MKKRKSIRYDIQVGFILLIILVSGCSYIIVYAITNLHGAVDDLIMVAERAQMYNRSIRLELAVNGVYYKDAYYCVWTEGRTQEEILKTECHETLHALINEDYDHFCKK